MIYIFFTVDLTADVDTEKVVKTLEYMCKTTILQFRTKMASLNIHIFMLNQ